MFREEPARNNYNNRVSQKFSVQNSTHNDEVKEDEEEFFHAQRMYALYCDFSRVLPHLKTHVIYCNDGQVRQRKLHEDATKHKKSI